MPRGKPNRHQHTIPQCYLRRFLEPGFVYRRGKDSALYTKTARNFAGRRDYYERGGPRAIDLDPINNLVETGGAEALKDLIEAPETLTLNDDGRFLSYLFAGMYVRNPSVIEMMRGTQSAMIVDAERTAQDTAVKLGDPSLADGMLFRFRQPEADYESPYMSLKHMKEYKELLNEPKGHLDVAPFDALLDIAKTIQQMSFLIYLAPKGYQFVTSDIPLVVRRRHNDSRVGAGWANRDAVGMIALCPSLFLLMIYHDGPNIRIMDATPEQVEEFNLLTLGDADQEVYCHTKYPKAHEWMKGVEV